MGSVEPKTKPINLADITKFLLIDIDKCVKAAWNYKNEDEVLTEKLIANLKRNGQIENIIVRLLETGFYEVVNGNHRLECMLRVGAKKIIAYNLGSISQGEAQRIAIETNETKYQTDPIKLASIISDLSKVYSSEDLLATMPYSQQEIDNYIEMNSFSWDNYKDGQEAKESQSTTMPNVTIVLTGTVLEAWNEWRKVCERECPDPAPTDIEVLDACIAAALGK